MTRQLGLGRRLKAILLFTTDRSSIQSAPQHARDESADSDGTFDPHWEGYPLSDDILEQLARSADASSFHASSNTQKGQ